MPVACAHCTLPIGRRALHATIDGVPGRYCCIGCILAHQITRAEGDEGRAAAVLIRLGVAVFFAMNVMMVTLPAYVPAVYGDAGVATDGPLFLLLRWLAMVFAAPVLVLLGWPILAAAWQAARAGVVTADALVVIGTVAAYGLSVANTIQGRAAVYYDTAAMLLVLVTLGRYLDARARADAGALVRRTLAREPTRACREEAGRVRDVPPHTLAPGDVVRVLPGDAFPTDGVVLSGVGGVDEAPLTGEATPVTKGPGDAVAGGTCSVDGTFRVRVRARAADSTVARIAELVDAGLRDRTHAERVADGVAAALLPIVLAVATGAALWWTHRAGIDRGLLVGLAVLVVACPCGLGLATPLALWTGMVTAARRGVVVRRAAVLERVAALGHVFFDKTGTLTRVTPRVTSIDPIGGVRPEEVLGLAAALEDGLVHPAARGIVVAARAAGITPPPVDALDVVPGRGVRGTVGGACILVGNAGWMEHEGIRVDLPSDGEGTPIAVARDGRAIGVIRLGETLVAGASETVGALRSFGLTTGLLSGDTRLGVLARLFADGERIGGLSAGDKVARVHARRQREAVAMVGDGFNDAPALAAADVGIAVGTAPDLTRVTADVLVLRGGVRQVPWLVGHARRVVRVARQNLAWAFGYNAVAVALAAAGQLNPLVAALAMLASSVAVVANARRLRTVDPVPATPARRARPARGMVKGIGFSGGGSG